MTEEKIVEVAVDFFNALEAACINAKHQIVEIVGVKKAGAVKEETFNILKFEKQQGAKIGQYEVAYKANNIEDKWTQAYNILKQENATINSRYHGEAYQHSYWLYGEGKIYRQKLNRK